MNSDNDKFSEEIKKTLEDAPFFEPTEQMIAEMERRLDAQYQEPQSRRVAWWWLLLIPLFVLPLFFSTIYFYHKFQSIQNQLSETIIDLNLEKDSSEQRSVKVLYDTIYQTIYKKEIISENSSNQKTPKNSNAFSFDTNPYPYRRSNALPDQAAYSLPLLNSISSQLIPGLSTADVYRFSNRSQLPLLSILHQKRNNDSAQSAHLTWRKPLSELNQLPLMPLFANSYDLDEEWEPIAIEDFDQQKKTNRDRLLAMVPIGFNAGFNVMPFFSFGTPGGTGFNLAYGGYGELVFRNNLRLGIAFNKLDITNKTEQNFSDYPSVSLEKPQDLIKELYINLNYLEVPVYFRYSFRSEKRFQPFVNLGMVARRALKQEFEYELMGDAGEYKRLVQIPATNFSISTAQAGIGLEFPVFKNLYASPQLLYKQNLKIPDFEKVKLNTLGLDLRLQYQF